MGQRLLQEYEKAKDLGGMKAQMRLAILTRMPATKAAEEPDSSENINKFTLAMREIMKEFKK